MYFIIGSCLKYYLQIIERENHEISPLCELGKGKFISGAADFGTAARRGHGFHTRPLFLRIKCGI